MTFRGEIRYLKPFFNRRDNRLPLDPRSTTFLLSCVKLKRFAIVFPPIHLTPPKLTSYTGLDINFFFLITFMAPQSKRR